MNQRSQEVVLGHYEDGEPIKVTVSGMDIEHLEKPEHQWVQRGRFLGCHCHPHTGSFLPVGKNLVGVKNGEPVFEKS